MTTVSLKKITPADDLVAEVAEYRIKDKRGREILLKKPGVLAQFHIVRAVGRDAENQVYMRMVLPLIYIESIDGDPIFCPKDPLTVDALIKRLDDDGCEAVMEGVSKHFGERDPEKDKLDLKK